MQTEPREPSHENRILKIHSVNLSEQKGTIKTPQDFIVLNNTGVENDAHAGHWHRQVSLLGKESADRFSEMAGRKINAGEFGENITTEGFEIFQSQIFDVFYNDEIELQVTQIGKKCHGDSCSIYREVGKCVMPKEGIFARVIKGGKVKPGDDLIYKPKIFKALIITLSDRAFNNTYADKSGPALKEKLTAFFDENTWRHEIENTIIPDNANELTELINKAKNTYDFVFTTGGTGIGPRDITVDTILPLLEKEIPGIMEVIRVKYGLEKPNAAISRGVAGVINDTLVFTLPGSVKAVNEYMVEISKVLRHLKLMLHGIDTH